MFVHVIVSLHESQECVLMDPALPGAELGMRGEAAEGSDNIFI